MITLNTLTRGNSRSKNEPALYRLQLCFKPQYGRALEESRRQLEQQLGSAVSWSVYVLYAARALSEALAAKNLPSIPSMTKDGD